MEATTGQQTYFSINHDHLEIQQQVVSNSTVRITYKLWSYQNTPWTSYEATELRNRLVVLGTWLGDIMATSGTLIVWEYDSNRTVDIIYRFYDEMVA